MHDIRESDWKAFRALHDELLDRLCGRILKTVRQKMNEPGQRMHARYLAVYKAVKNGDREVARLFNGMSRSSAVLQLLMMAAEGLLLAEDLERFSPELREQLRQVRERKSVL